MFVIYGACAVAAPVSLVLFLFGRLFGGTLDPVGSEASRIADDRERAAAINALPAPAGWSGRVGRVLNALGDNLQRASGLAFFFATLVAAVFGGILWWQEGKHLFVAAVSAVAAAQMLYYLSAPMAEREKRAKLVSTLLTFSVLGAVVLQVAFQNNAAWYRPQVIVAHATIRGQTEDFPVLTTPNGTFLDLERLVGGDANRVRGKKDDGTSAYLAMCLPQSNPDLAGYEARCNDGYLELRAQRGKPHGANLAAAEFSSVAEIGLARRDARLAETEREIVQQKKAERLEAGKIPLTTTLASKFPIKTLAVIALALFVALLLIRLGFAEKAASSFTITVNDKKDDPKPAAPKAA